MKKVPSKLAHLIAMLVVLGSAKAADPTTANVAFNRAAYQSSAINHDNVAHLATDGSDETFWQSEAEEQPWIYVDLGASRTMNGVRLMWGEMAPGGCTIQVASQPGAPLRWTDVAHFACPGSRTSSGTFAATEARYVRMLAEKGAPLRLPAQGVCRTRDAGAGDSAC